MMLHEREDTQLSLSRPESGSITVFTLGAGRVAVANFMSRSSYPEKRTPVPKAEEAGWTLVTNWTFWRRKSLLTLPEFEAGSSIP
jgi:hypothetical protein